VLESHFCLIQRIYLEETMRIYINARFLTQPVTGVQRGAVELVKALDMLIDRGEIDSSQYSFCLLSPNKVRYELNLKHIPLHKVGFLSGHAWEQIELPLYSYSGLLISLCNAAPLLKFNQIVTIHDALVFGLPQAFSIAFRTWYKLLSKVLGITARKIITDSFFSKGELIKYCGIAESKLRVLYFGKDHILSVKPGDNFLEKHRLLDKPFLLVVSSINNPNKNFNSIVKAMELLGNMKFDVVITGGTKLHPNVFSQLGIPLSLSNLKNVGYVNDSELRTLYEHAACFAYPSFYEGFGLPPLEAMTCGCPVVVSNTSSLPEVCGEAAYYVNPYSVESIAEGIHKVLTDEDLRKSLIQKGFERVKMFSWENYAREALKIFEEVLHS